MKREVFSVFVVPGGFVFFFVYCGKCDLMILYSFVTYIFCFLTFGELTLSVFVCVVYFFLCFVYDVAEKSCESW